MYLLLSICLLGGAYETSADAKIERLLDAIQAVETGGCKDPAKAVGDGGKSRGWYQIGYAYWLDATGVRASASAWRAYLACVRDREASRRVVRGYWQRYELQAYRDCDSEILARCHNGGCGWRKAGPKAQAMMDSYVAKVRKAMR